MTTSDVTGLKYSMPKPVANGMHDAESKLNAVVQASTLYIFKMAPSSKRGTLGIMFQLVQCVGILVAYV